MAKTGYRVTWVPQTGADTKALLAQHQRTFPGNQLAIVKGYVKVSVLDSEAVPVKSLLTNAVRVEWTKTTETANGTIPFDGKL